MIGNRPVRRYQSASTRRWSGNRRVMAGWPAATTSGRVRREQRVDPTLGQQVAKGRPGGGHLHGHVRRQVDRGALARAGPILATEHPGQVARPDTVVLLEDPAQPQVEGQLVLHRPDPLAAQVAGLDDARVAMDVDRVVAERARRIDGDARRGRRHPGRSG